MLQVRCAHPTGTGEPRQPLSPLRRTAPLTQGSRRATPQALRASSPYIGEPGQPLGPLRWTAPPFAPTQLFELRRCCAWLIKIREHTVLSYLKRTCFRFAARTLRVQGSQGKPSGGAAEGKTPAQEIAARALEAGNRDLYCIGGMSPCSVRAALRSWWRRAYSS